MWCQQFRDETTYNFHIIIKIIIKIQTNYTQSYRNQTNTNGFNKYQGNSRKNFNSNNQFNSGPNRMNNNGFNSRNQNSQSLQFSGFNTNIYGYYTPVVIMGIIHA